MHKLMFIKFCIVFPWQRYIPAWTHDVKSHSSVAKQQQSIRCMVLYIAYSDAGQFIACMCQITRVYVSLRQRYESTLSYFWLTLVFCINGVCTNQCLAIHILYLHSIAIHLYSIRLQLIHLHSIIFTLGKCVVYFVTEKCISPWRTRFIESPKTHNCLHPTPPPDMPRYKLAHLDPPTHTDTKRTHPLKQRHHGL